MKIALLFSIDGVVQSEDNYMAAVLPDFLTVNAIKFHMDKIQKLQIC